MSVIRSLGDPPNEDLLQEATRVVRDGGIIAIPTESSYALGVAVRNDSAIARIKELKGRPDDKPVLVLIADRTQLRLLTPSIPPAAAILMDAFWPGPLTLTFPIAPDLPRVLAGRGGTLGIRQPGHRSLLVVLQRVGPLTGTSANRSEEPSMNSAPEILSEFGHAIDLILDGGRTVGGLPSTLVDTLDSLRILREGPITREQIDAALQRSGMKLESTRADET